MSPESRPDTPPATPAENPVSSIAPRPSKRPKTLVAALLLGLVVAGVVGIFLLPRPHETALPVVSAAPTPTAEKPAFTPFLDAPVPETAPGTTKPAPKTPVKPADLAALRAAIAKNPRDLAAQVQLATYFQQKDDPKGALPHLEAAAKLAPQNPAILFQLARTYLVLRQAPKALMPLQKVVQIAPKERAAQALLAQVYLDQKKPKLAYDLLAGLAQNAPQDIESHLAAASIANDVLKKPAEAEKWLRRVLPFSLSDKGRNPQPAIFLSRLQMARRDTKGAAKTLEAAAKAQPTLLELYPALSEARAVAGDTPGAILALQTGLKKLPQAQGPQKRAVEATQASFHVALGRLFGNSKRPKDARREFLTATQLAPNDPDAQSLLATASIQNGDVKAAQVALRRALKLDPKRAPDAHFLAEVLAQSGDWKAADAQFAAYTKMQPKDPQALLQWAQVLARAQQPQRELAIWQKLEKIAPQNPLAMIQQGVLLRQMKRSDESLQKFQRALQLAPNDPNALVEVARGQSKRKQWPQAAANWEKLLAIRPDYVPAYAALLETSANARTLVPTRLFLARTVAKTSENPQILSTILSFYNRTNRSDEARAFLQDVTRRNAKLGMARRALDSFQKPSNPPIEVLPKTSVQIATPTPAPEKTAAPEAVGP